MNVEKISYRGWENCYRLSNNIVDTRALDVSLAELVSGEEAHKLNIHDARGVEVAQLMRGLDAKDADDVLEIVKTVVKMASYGGRIKELKAAEQNVVYAVGKRKKKK